MNKEENISSDALKIRDIKPGDVQLTLYFKVLEKQTERTIFSRKDKTTHRIAEFLVGDDTGVIVLTAWDDTIDRLSIGKTYKLMNAYAEMRSGYLRVVIGRHSKLEEANVNLGEINMLNNRSQMTAPIIDYSMYPRSIIKGETKPSRSRRRRR